MLTGKYFINNRKILEHKHPTIVNALDDVKDVDENVFIEKTRSELLTIRYKETLLHSAYDPRREAKKFIEKQKISKGNAILIFGFGLGYHVEEALTAVGERGKVFVVEPNRDVLRAALAVRDFTELLADARFFLISAKKQDALAMHFLAFIDRQLINGMDDVKSIVIHEPSLKCLPPEFEKLGETFQMLMMDRRTPDVFRDKNISNFHGNVRNIVSSSGLSEYANKFKGIPAFYINAGPSLDAALPRLKKYRAKAIFACCDTALPALIDNGITPDFVVSVDPQAKSAKHFIGYHNCGAILLYTPSAFPSIVAGFKGKRIVFLQKNHSLTGKMEDLLGDKGFTYAGSSVSCIGLDVLMQMGCKDLILVGMDYSFSGGKMYSTNVFLGKTWLSCVDRFNTLERKHYESIRSDKIISIKNKFGEDVPTHRALYSYRRQVEMQIEDSENVSFYNFASLGIPIAGAEEIFLDEELDSILRKDIKIDLKLRDEEENEELVVQLMRIL